MKRNTLLLLATILIVFNASAAASDVRTKMEFTSSVSKKNRELFAAARSCPLIQLRNVNLLSQKRFEVQLHRCDEEISDAFPKRLLGYSQSEFLLIVDSISKNAPLLAGFMSVRQFEAIKPVQIGDKNFLLLETAREGSGEYSEWCLMGELPGMNRVGCLGKADEEALAKPYMKRGEGTKAWHPSFRDGQLTVSALVEHDGDANCCPSRGNITLTFEVKGAALRVTKVSRISASTKNWNSKRHLKPV